MGDLPFRQIVNELSFEEGAASADYANRMMRFLHVVLKLANAGMDKSLTVSRRLTSRTTEGGRALYEWLFDLRNRAEYHEEKSVLRSMFTKGLNTEDIFPMCDFAEEISFADDGMQLCTADYMSGLVVSYHLNLPAVSFPCDGRHCDGVYNIDIRTLRDVGGDCTLGTKPESIHTVVNLSQVNKELDRIRLESIKALMDCDSITGVFNDMLPHLEFSTKAAIQLDASDFRHDKQAFQWFCLTLFKLDYAWRQVKSGEERDFFVALNMGNRVAPTESGATRGAYSSERTFLAADGCSHECFAHCKNMFLNKRIYFEKPNSDTQRLFVGCIGGHLPIVSD